MRFNKSILKKYLTEAPIPLALERVLECKIYENLEFKRPILDVGCGDGIFTKVLFGEKIDVGIDPLEYELEKAKKQAVYEKLFHAWGNRMPFENDSFLTVFSNSVLEHISDIDSVLKEINRVMKIGGTLYVTLPTNLFDQYTLAFQAFNFLGLTKLKESYRIFFNKFWKHQHYYSRNEWIKLFKKNGFEINKVQEYGTKGQCMFNDFMVPFTIPNYLIKKLLNRFFLFSALRRMYTPFLALFLKNKTVIYPDLKTGGLIFFELQKVVQSIC